MIQTEFNRQNHVAIYGFSVIHSGLPVGHAFDYAHGLFIQKLMNTTFDLHIGDLSVVAHYKADINLALQVQFFGQFRITNVVFEVFE